MIDKNKKAFVGLFAVALFVLLVFYVPNLFEQGLPEICIEGGECQHEVYLESVIAYIPAIIVLGFLFGVTVSFLYFERKAELPAPAPDRKEAVLSLLHSSEKKVIAKVVENGGEALQSEVSRIEGMGKVKAHRVIERLVKRGVLQKEQKGKTNVLKLKKSILDVMKD